MLIETLKAIFYRDLEKLKAEILLYTNENNLWNVENSIANSAGNLCLHLIGNLNTYIGREIGGFDYVRNRNLEFSLKNTPKAELIQKIDETIEVVTRSLDKLNMEDMLKEYPIRVFDKSTSTEYLLVHLTTHLAYHLGQINYHRKFFEN